MSTSLFCLALDPFLRAILSRFPYNNIFPTTALEAYLDDIAMVLSHTVRQPPLVLRIFESFRCGAGPGLNYKKTVIIPLWNAALEETRAFLHRLIPETSQFVIAWAATFLGVMIGPVAHLIAWDAPFNKYESCVTQCRAFRLGLANTISSQCLCFLYTLTCFAVPHP